MKAAMKQMEKRMELYRKLLIWNIIFMLGLLCWGNMSGQYKWQKTFGGNNFDNPDDIIKTNNGYVIGASSWSNIGADKSENSRGGSMDYWLIKIDKAGNKIWDKTYGSNVSDELGKVYQTSDKGFLLCGESRGTNNFDKTDTLFGDRDIWIVKVDSNGNKVWDRAFGGIGAEYFGGFVESNSSYYFVCKSGSSNTGNKTSFGKGYSDIWLFKTDKQGNKIMDISYGGLDNDDAFGGINKINENSFVICGSSASNASSDKSNNTYTGIRGVFDYWVIKIDSNGNKIWDKIYGSSGNEQLRSSKLKKGKIILYGGTSGSTTTDFDMTGNRVANGGFNLWTIMIDTNGNKLWDKLILSDSSASANSIDFLDNGNILLGSETNASYGYDKTESNRGDDDCWIIMLDSSGNKLWDKTIGTTGIESYMSLLRADSNSTIVAAYSTKSGPNIDKTISSNVNQEIWVFELKDPVNKITGKVYPDFNSNCSLDSPSEYSIANRIIYNSVEKSYTISNDNNYILYNYGSDSAILKVINVDSPLYVACAKDSIKVKFNGLVFKDTSGIDFPIRSTKSGSCLTITSHSNSLLRQGRWSTYTLCYQNNAFDTAKNAYIEVKLDLGDIDSISSPLGYTQTGNKLIFQLGNIPPFKTGCITYLVKIKINKKIGSKHCHKSRIFPDCNTKKHHPDEDSSDIECSIQCLPNDTVELTLTNIGSKNQKDWGLIKSYEDVIIFAADTFKLNVGSSQVFKYKLDTNKVFTAEIFNNNFHPIFPILIRQDDLCANKQAIISNNPALNFSRHDEAKEYEEACDIIRGSYDPNIKSVQPIGMFTEHYTATGIELKYRIDFQNTGSDTAFRVVLIDTLSSLLDISTFVSGVSSHSYSVEFGQNRALKFIFDPIALIDSGTNEPASHGFVTFKIKHIAGITLKSKIENKADIYFDYNTPVRTNTVFNTIFDTIQIYVPKGNNSIAENEKTAIIVFPNPTTDKFIVQVDEPTQDLAINIYDMNGRYIKSVLSKNNKTIEVSAEGMTKGLYHIHVLSKDKFIAVKKLQVQ